MDVVPAGALGGFRLDRAHRRSLLRRLRIAVARADLREARRQEIAAAATGGEHRAHGQQSHEPQRAAA